MRNLVLVVVVGCVVSFMGGYLGARYTHSDMQEQVSQLERDNALYRDDEAVYRKWVDDLTAERVDLYKRIHSLENLRAIEQITYEGQAAKVVTTLEEILGYDALDQIHHSDESDQKAVTRLLQEAGEKVAKMRAQLDILSCRSDNTDLKQVGMWLVLPERFGKYTGNVRFTDLAKLIREDSDFPLAYVESCGGNTTYVIYEKDNPSQQCSWDWKQDESCYRFLAATGLDALLLE